jgi:putative colanic acid biosynthesis acetyltransferase WcaF
MNADALNFNAGHAHYGSNPVPVFANPHSLRNKFARVVWSLVWNSLFRWSPRLFFGWRNQLLRCFGARIGRGCRVYPSCKIWAPWNLEMLDGSCLGPEVDCYTVDKVLIGSHATVSQYSYLCTASHDITSPVMRLVTAPINIGTGAWVCAGVFVGPGVTIGQGAVAAARSVVVKDVQPWNVVGGNPSRFIKMREIKSPASPSSAAT